MTQTQREDGLETNKERPTGIGSSVSWRIAAVLAAAFVAMVVMLASQGAFKSARASTLVGVLVVGALSAAIVLIMVNARRKKTRRIDHTHTLSDDFGLTFHKGNFGDVKKRFHRLPEVKKSGEIKKVIEGELAGREFVGFEHLYMIYTGNATVPVQRTVYAVATPDWPRVTIRSRRFIGAWIRKLFGKADLQLDLPEFNKRCRVTTDNEDFAFLLLTQDLQQHILDKPAVVWRLFEGWLCLIYNGPMKLDRMPTSLHRLERFVELIPPELNNWTENEKA